MRLLLTVMLFQVACSASQDKCGAAECGDDIDGDGATAEWDIDDADPYRCLDQDNDRCDDCALTGPDGSGGDPANDGEDSDDDGKCDVSDYDADNDGVADIDDLAPFDPWRCRDFDGDLCDDCSRTGADGSGGDPDNDGYDPNEDGMCEWDRDGDGVNNEIDLDPTDASKLVDCAKQSELTPGDCEALVAILSERAIEGQFCHGFFETWRWPIGIQRPLAVENKRVVRLHLEHCEITGLSPQVSALDQLRSLHLHELDAFTHIPTEIGDLSKLESFAITSGLITSLPDSIGNLKQLKELTLAYGRLVHFPDALTNLTRLESLVIEGHPIEELPSSIARLSALKTLKIKDTPMRGLPNSFGQLSQLEELILTRNQIVSLPQSLSLLTRLRELRVTLEPIRSLPDLSALTALETIVLSNNALTTLTLGPKPALTWLSVRHNYLTSLPDEVSQMTRLQSLDVTGNELRDLPDLSNLTALRSLEAANNLIGAVPFPLTPGQRISSCNSTIFRAPFRRVGQFRCVCFV